MPIITPEKYFGLAVDENPQDDLTAMSAGYAALPSALLIAEREVAAKNLSAALSFNRVLCKKLLEQFDLAASRWDLPDQFYVLYEHQLRRIENQLSDDPDSYFSLSNDPFRKDLAILRHRLIPFGAELATPWSGIPRSLILKGGVRQAGKFVNAIFASGGTKPFLELHMHPRDTTEFNPQGWLETYENLADFLAANKSLRGVQSTSWFLDPALEKISPRLAYLRQVPERCGAAILYAGDDNVENSGAFAKSQRRRELHQAGHYHPRLFTRVWPRRQLLRRGWRNAP